MRYLKLFILLFCIISSCKNAPELPIYNQDIQQVIVRCIISTMRKGDSARYYHKLIPEIDKKDYLRFGKKYNDSLKSLLDTALVYLIVKDTLGKIGWGSREDLDHFVKNNLSDIDSSSLYFRDELSNPPPQTLDIKQLEKELYIPIRSQAQGVNEKLRIIGTCIFSNVIFNKKRSRAVVLIDYMSTTHTGYGELFLLNKEGRNWKIIKRERTWVS